jgi:hypothetical protein
MLNRRELITAFLGWQVASSVGCSRRPLPAQGELFRTNFGIGHKIRDGHRPQVAEDDFEEVGVVIVGGGVAGLTAGWRLLQAGFTDFVLLELEDQPGGTARSGSSGNFAYPWGAHYVPVPMAENRLLIKLLEEMKIVDRVLSDGSPVIGEQFLCRDPHERLFHDGTWHGGIYPIDGASADDLRQLDEFQAEIDRWEGFLNGDSLKQQLMSRYLYEHWFLGHLYFSEVSSSEFFKVVRSSTPPGEAIKLLPTRRPYDDPGVERVHYRLWRDHETVLDKTHLPYALDGKRMAWLQGLFLDIDYAVTELPSYEPEVAANPFIAFQAIPVQSRWDFILTEAQFTIMNFIKGPVCRGQIAVDVIRDNFWVFFESPQIPFPEKALAFLSQQQGNLEMPSQAGSSAAPIGTWGKYAKSQQAYLKAKSDFMSEVYAGGKGVTLDLVWDGDGYNQNAALTVFRHFDTASIVKGLVGPTPKTAWLITYSILERIHYLLVAGFDVYGNLGHQMTTRLYMDFLRMEGEFNFLALLPADVRHSVAQDWYQGASKKQQSYVYGSRADFEQPTSISYKTDDPKQELFGMLKQRLAPALNREYELSHEDAPAEHREALQRLQAVEGLTLSTLPQITYLNVESASGNHYYYTILRNSAHSNISSMLAEGGNLEPAADTLTVVRNFIGSYPNAYWRVSENDLPELVAQVSKLSDDASYAALMERYGVRRTSPEFWQHSDKVMRAHHAADPLANALLDYNRFENR